MDEEATYQEGYEDGYRSAAGELKRWLESDDAKESFVVFGILGIQGAFRRRLDSMLSKFEETEQE